MASNGSAKLVPLGATARAIVQIFRQPKTEITGVETSQAFGPLQPFRPLGGPDAEPWISQIIPGQNLTYTPRARETLTSIDLRDASMYDIIRIIIENVLDQVTRMPLNVRVKRRAGESGKEYAKRKPDARKIQDISDRLARPNLDQHQSQFMRLAMDDMLVIDAASILKRRTKKGGIYDWRAIDGAQIARYFDAWGATPQPPDPAYAQIWDAGQSGGVGIPWVDLTIDQLNYAMRNLKTYRLYGMSPVEQAINLIQTGALRLQFQKDYYTAGSIPDLMQIVPSGVSRDKFKETQKTLNAELSGILFKRRQIRLIQGFHEDATKEQLIQPKEQLLKDEMDDYVIRVCCYCLGTSPQRLQRVMGMRSGQVNQEAAEKEGLEPWLDWATNLVWNRMIADLDNPADIPGAREYEAVYEEDTDVDSEKQSKIWDVAVRNGSMTVNELREENGDEPYLNVPEADQPMIYTPTGPIPLSIDIHVERTKKMQDAMPEPDEGNDGPQSGKKKKKVAKRAAIINPDHDTPARRGARARLEKALAFLFERQRGKATAKAQEIFKVRKSEDSDAKADSIFQAIESEFSSLPVEARAALEAAAVSGINDAYLQISIDDVSLIGEANREAAEWAAKRAAELVGMKYSEDGELVPNPRAKWAISDTTRERLREIVRNAFEEKAPMSEIVDDIQNADVFSEGRAATIARTEVSNAQVKANLDFWKKAGVPRVKWLAHGPDPCPMCLLNDGEIRDIGDEFPSGAIYPLQHPNCYCYLQAVTEE